jgi:hypothetical protein
MGELEGKRPLGRSRHTWKNNIKMNIRDIRWGYVDWIGVTQVGTSGGLM